MEASRRLPEMCGGGKREEALSHMIALDAGKNFVEKAQ
jgi:hypothetical protein